MHSKTLFIYIAILFYCSIVSAQNDSILTFPKDTGSIENSGFTPVIEQVNTNETKPGKIYHLNPIVDIPVFVIGGGWSVFALPKIYSKDAPTIEEINNLKESDIPSFDRWAAGKSDKKADSISDFPFYGSMVVPFGLLADKEIRHDAAKIGFLYLEAMAITGLIYTGCVYFVDRYRPETYNTSIPVEERAKGNNKDAFLAGHPAVVATATFFTAKIYSDYHPESNWKYALYGFAVAATGTTVYLRHIAGKHFPSDLFAGVAVGTLSGILVPHFHKNREVKNRNLGFMPFSNGTIHGIAMTYKFK